MSPYYNARREHGSISIHLLRNSPPPDEVPYELRGHVSGAVARFDFAFISLTNLLLDLSRRLVDSSAENQGNGIPILQTAIRKTLALLRIPVRTESLLAMRH